MQVGQNAQIKLAAYPFQKYGMQTGRVINVGADATETAKPSASVNKVVTGDRNAEPTNAGVLMYKARRQFDQQIL